ncbi:OmpA family protein [Allohahella marinimesophila]|uniref:OmpA family protein n=1 Tax=Allohahella marinimesophila TaxID=1054972 RepID=A0ABP7PUZ3_9GAMM
MSIRMKTAVTAVALSTCMASLAPAVQARDSDVGAYLTGQVGYYWFDDELNLENRPEYGLGFGYNFSNTWALELVGSAMDTGRDDINQDIDRNQLRLDALYTFSGYDSMKPYLVLGAGHQAYQIKNADNEHETMYNAGVGVKHEIDDFTDLRMDARTIYTERTESMNAAVTVSLNYLFGAKSRAMQDSDGDGVVDTEDECANTPYDTEVDEVGCEVIGDDDDDGVANDVDECPDTEAGADVDEKGCAIPDDSDNDGVKDEDDECPNTPEGVEVDNKGCPLDQDNDGVADGKDECPDTVEGSKVDETGCRIFAVEGVETQLRVTFPLNSAILADADLPEIEALARFMKRYPDAKVTIEGHSDSTGEADYNQQLSERRAKAVRDRVVQDYGIEPSRVTSVGYGEARPLADNSTNAGRAANRRVVVTAQGSIQKEVE